jgi:hypothetical protein
MMARGASLLPDAWLSLPIAIVHPDHSGKRGLALAFGVQKGAMPPRGALGQWGRV